MEIGGVARRGGIVVGRVISRGIVIELSRWIGGV